MPTKLPIYISIWSIVSVICERRYLAIESNYFATANAYGFILVLDLRIGPAAHGGVMTECKGLRSLVLVAQQG
jgi:hypothetical protein